MNVRLIAVDLDGTLLGDDLTISQIDRTAIRRAKDAGMAVCLATGRMYSASRRFADALDLTTPLACLQGAAVYDVRTDRPMRFTPLARDVALRAFDFMSGTGYHVQLYFGDELFVEQIDERAKEYLRRSQVEATIVPQLRAMLAQADASRGALLKVLGIAAPDEVERDIPRIVAMLGEGNANVMKSQAAYLEVTDPHADKGEALRFIAEALGIQLADTAAIGDSDNDAPMLRIAGASFAVAGGSAVAREAAGRVVGAQGVGVAEAIGALCDADACGIP